MTRGFSINGSDLACLLPLSLCGYMTDFFTVCHIDILSDKRTLAVSFYRSYSTVVSHLIVDNGRLITLHCPSINLHSYLLSRIGGGVEYWNTELYPCHSFDV